MPQLYIVYLDELAMLGLMFQQMILIITLTQYSALVVLSYLHLRSDHFSLSRNNNFLVVTIFLKLGKRLKRKANASSYLRGKRKVQSNTP